MEDRKDGTILLLSITKICHPQTRHVDLGDGISRTVEIEAVAPLIGSAGYDFIWKARFNTILGFIQLHSTCDDIEDNVSTCFNRELVPHGYRVITRINTETIVFAASSNSYVKFMVPSSLVSTPYEGTPSTYELGFREIVLESDGNGSLLKV